MSDSPDAGISFSVPSQAPGMIIGGGCPLLYEEGLGRRAVAGEGVAAAAAARAFPGGPPGAPPPGTFWNEESSSSACPAAAARAKASGGGGSNRRTTVSYVINEESPALLQTAESGALQSLKEACEAVGASLETLHFGKLDFGETAVLDRFYNAEPVLWLQAYSYDSTQCAEMYRLNRLRCGFCDQGDICVTASSQTSIDQLLKMC